ncbi:HNH endonuclease signature motif containing protein [Pseudomonas chlororaphis]|uniref:HNH endonuclease signature motif containing protein n=1 Tax=Pseudomonas chlororaphis TaxID=587753 RepID=UPI003B75BC5D
MGASRSTERSGAGYVRPEVVTTTRQDYLGESYYLCGFYFQRDGKRLHRTVWEDNFGPIPSGFHVHHKDHNRSNNQPENLELLGGTTHIKLHLDEQRDFRRALWDGGIGAKMLAAATVWHQSEAGRQWHREQYERTKDALHAKRHDLVCTVCGTQYATFDKGSLYCSKKCKATARRRAGTDNEERSCPVCKQAYVANRYSHRATCSRSCGATAIHQGVQIHEVRACAVCQGGFRAAIASRAIYCSRTCKAKAARSVG